jgi:PKD repeat protein
MRPTGLALLVLSLLAALLVSSAALAEEPAPREFAPVQLGPTREAASSLPYAPGRIRVKFTEDAIRNSSLGGVDMRRGATVGRASIGLVNVDALAAEIGVTRVVRQHDMPGDADMARRLGVDRWFLMHFPDDVDVFAVAERLSGDPDVEYALPDWKLYPAATPNDPLYPDNWGHNNTAQMLSYDWATYSHENGDPVGTVGFDSNAPAAWDASSGYGSSGVTIAIIDGGVDVDHPDIPCVAGYDHGSGDSDPDDDSGQPGHGTCCAGVAAAVASNNMGAVGIAGGCKIMPMKIANNAGTMYISTMPPAIYWAVDNGADVISMSIGAPLSSEPDTDAAILYAWNHGVVVLAATGNYNTTTIDYPAINTYAIGVGAASPCGERKRSSSSSFECNPGVSTDPNGYTCDGERWWGSNYGPATQDAAGAVDVLAPTILPTTDILGSAGYQSGDYEMWFNGTSCATPYAAGVCALIKSAFPSYTAQQIRDRLCDTAEDVISVESGSGWDRYAGYGMVDAEAAVGGSQPQPPVAQFSGSPTSGYVPLTVDFTDESTGSPTSWSWDFGDGVGTSTQQNPSYTYTSPGTYTVTLTAANAYGSDDEVKTGYISVTVEYPVADFSGSPTAGNAPLTVDFTDLSAGSPTSWSWDFGDGVGTSTAQNPSYTYTSDGVYTVELTATNAHGSDTETKAGYITVQDLQIVRSYAGADLSVAGSVSGDFTDTHASDNVREAITEVAYGGHPRKTYSYLEHQWQFNVTGGTAVDFYLEAYRPASSDGDNFTFAYSTDLATWYTLATVASATEQVYHYSMPTNTSGTVYVRVVDTVRTWGTTANDAVYVDEMYFESLTTPQPPVADFAGNPTSGYAPLTVQFTDTSTGLPTSWSWDFGDGVGASSEQNPSYTYTSIGTYTVSLTATNDQGTDTKTKNGYVTVSDQPSNALYVSDITVGRTYDGRFYRGQALVTVVNTYGTPVSGATVSGTFNAPSTKVKTGTTGGSGVATVTSDKTKTPPADWCFTVTGVALSGHVYDAGSNAVTTACESGWQSALAQSGADISAGELGLRFARPNPFSEATEIGFALMHESHVLLEVYSVAGRRVAVLADRVMGPGPHSIEWRAAGQPSGVYFCRMTTAEGVESKTMVLIR